MIVAPIAIALAMGSFFSGKIGNGVIGLVVAGVALFFVLFVRTPPAPRRRLENSVVGGELIGSPDDASGRFNNDPGGLA